MNAAIIIFFVSLFHFFKHTNVLVKVTFSVMKILRKIVHFHTRTRAATLIKYLQLFWRPEMETSCCKRFQVGPPHLGWDLAEMASSPLKPHLQKMSEIAQLIGN